MNEHDCQFTVVENHSSDKVKFDIVGPMVADIKNKLKITYVQLNDEETANKVAVAMSIAWNRGELRGRIYSRNQDAVDTLNLEQIFFGKSKI